MHGMALPLRRGAVKRIRLRSPISLQPALSSKHLLQCSAMNDSRLRRTFGEGASWVVPSISEQAKASQLTQKFRITGERNV
jgi:hypothetical protein